MPHRVWKIRFWGPAGACAGGGIGMVLLGAACFRMGTGLATAAFALLIVVTLMSLLGNFAVSIALSCMAVLCLSFFFAEPVFSVRVANTVDVSALLAFLTTSIVITGLSVRVRRLAERKLAQSRADLARFARVASLGELTASIAHEVNQPLAGVVSSGDACQRWLAGEPPNLARAMQSLDRIIRDAHRASQVVERIRNLAKNAPPQKASVNLNEAVLEIIGLASDEIEQGRISLKTQLGEDVPPVWADRIQLQQVMLNLIINAIEAVGEIDGPRQLSVGTERAHGSGVLLSVRDSGKGLDAEQAEHIFDPFYTTKPEGMGMGLAVSRGIIEAHGGRLWATWNEPPGTVFRFTLPTEARS